VQRGGRSSLRRLVRIPILASLNGCGLAWRESEPVPFGVTVVTKRGGADADGYGFDFGPYNEKAGDFSERYGVVIRQTASSDLMLLIQDVAKTAYGETVKNV
jgi:hypothetical protein